MAFIMNASVEPVKVRVYGKFFKFKPEQIKNLQPHFADMMAIEKGYTGLVRLSDKFEDLEYKASKKGQEEIAKARAEGVEKRVKHLQSCLRNELQGLQQDLISKNIKADPRLFMQDGMIKNMEELGKYKSANKKTDEEKVDMIKELEDSLGLADLSME